MDQRTARASGNHHWNQLAFDRGSGSNHTICGSHRKYNRNYYLRAHTIARRHNGLRICTRQGNGTAHELLGSRDCPVRPGVQRRPLTCTRLPAHWYRRRRVIRWRYSPFSLRWFLTTSNVKSAPFQHRYRPPVSCLSRVSVSSMKSFVGRCFNYRWQAPMCWTLRET
jgi:hypothetical protein